MRGSFADDDDDDAFDDDEPRRRRGSSRDHDEDRDAPLASDQDRPGSDDFEIVPCPYCGKSISDLAEVCPHCRSYISKEDAPSDDGRPLWVTVVTVLIIVSLLFGVVSLR